MATILRDAGLSELIESETVERLAERLSVHRGPALVARRLAAVPGHQGRADLSAGPGPFGPAAAGADRSGQRPDVRAGRFDRLLRAERPARLADDSPTAAASRRRRDLGRARGSTAPTTSSAGPTACLLHRPALRRRAVAASAAFPGRFRPRPGRGRRQRRSALLADDFEKPNGLAFSPDERTLYVCDTGRYHVRAFDVEPSTEPCSVGSGRVFARLDPGQPGGPDGMKVDQAGRVYVAVALGVWVFEPDGRLLGILALPARPSNLAWCDPDARGLAITAVDAVYYVRLRVEGIMPPFLPR